MIATALIVCILTSISNIAEAQDKPTNKDSKRIYFRIGGGYSFQSGKTEFNDADPNGITGIKQSTDIFVSEDGNSINVKSLNGTVGEGIKASITVGYMFNPYIGAELTVSYFHGSKTLIGRLRSPQGNSEENVYLRGFDVAPGIILTPNFKKVNPYTRLGFIFPVSGDLTIETVAKKVNGGGAGTDILVEAKSKVKSEFSMGYYGAIGVNFSIKNNISIFVEVEFKNLSIKSNSAKIEEYSTTAITNGQSQLVPGQQLADLTVYQSQFDFTNNYNQSAILAPNQNEPRKIPTQYVNTSGTGINLGLRFSL